MIYIKKQTKGLNKSLTRYRAP